MKAYRFRLNDLVIRVFRYPSGNVRLFDMTVTRKGVIVKTELVYSIKEASELVRELI